MSRNFENIVFPDKLVLEYPAGQGPANGVLNWNLLEDFSVEWIEGAKKFKYVAKAGLITDMPSIPGWAQSIVHKDGPKVLPSIIHDDMYERRAELGPLWTRKEVDRLLYYGARAAGTPWLEANEMYYAVRVGGNKAWLT